MCSNIKNCKKIVRVFLGPGVKIMIDLNILKKSLPYTIKTIENSRTIFNVKP